jgi:hypothetical protein
VELERIEIDGRSFLFGELFLAITTVLGNSLERESRARTSSGNLFVYHLPTFLIKGFK